MDLEVQNLLNFGCHEILQLSMLLTQIMRLSQFVLFADSPASAVVDENTRRPEPPRNPGSTLPHTLANSHPLSHTHTLTHTLAHSHTHTLTHSHIHTLTHSHIYSSLSSSFLLFGIHFPVSLTIFEIIVYTHPIGWEVII